MTFGFQPAGSTGYWWGARAIYQNGTVDIVWDRQQCTGEATIEERKALEHWINARALPALRKMLAQEFLGTQENRIVEYRADGFVLQANPKGSYGYLYLGAAKEAVPPPQAAEAEVIGRKDNLPIYRVGGYEGIWSGNQPVPAIGSSVVDHAQFGLGIVEGYFSGAGYLGILLRPLDPPAWWVKQSQGKTAASVFGIDLDPRPGK